MEEGETQVMQSACSDCGERQAVVRDGFLYCIECGTRAAHSQPLVEFSQEIFTTNMISVKKLAKTKSDKETYGNMWSTWHAHNMILSGLVEEMVGCGANKLSLPETVLQLWTRWLRLHKIAFFSKSASSASFPELPINFKARDLEQLYGIKKPKKPKKRNTVSEAHSTQRQKEIKSKTALVREEYKQFQESQASQINFQIQSQTLDEVKLAEQEKPAELILNKEAENFLKKTLTLQDYQLHLKSGFCSSQCKCFEIKRKLIGDRVASLSIYNLYTIIFLALRINNEDIHLGDIIRWCKESHISYGNYKHFFPEDMTFTSKDLFIFQSLMSHKMIRKTSACFLNSLCLTVPIESPRLLTLVERYLLELQLPNELIDLVAKIMASFPLLKNYSPKTDGIFPNYEAMALGYILIILKLLFGLDGVSENKMSSQTEIINSFLSSENPSGGSQESTEYPKLFIWRDWTKYIEYRKICLSQFHYPTAIRLDPEDADKPELFLHHRQTTQKCFDDSVKKNDSPSLIIKSMLSDVKSAYEHIDNNFPTFSISLTPMTSYVEQLLSWYEPTADVNINRKILEKEFTKCDVSFLVDTSSLAKLLNSKNCRLSVYKHKSNMDTTVDLKLSRHMKNITADKLSRRNCNDYVKVKDCSNEKWKRLLKSELISKLIDEAESMPAKKIITLAPYGRLKMLSQSTDSIKTENTAELTVCYDNYWVRHYPHFENIFSNRKFEDELDSEFPPSFAWLLREFASMGEMSTRELYLELSRLELNLVEKKQVIKKMKTDTPQL